MRTGESALHVSFSGEVLERGPDLAATAAAVRTAFSHVQAGSCSWPDRLSFIGPKS